MKIGILLTARLGSSRLRRKHLLEVNGSPLMSFLLDRINAEFAAEIAANEALVVIATSDEPENRDFERFGGPAVEVFFGSLHNIPLRHLQAAERLGLDAIVAVDGDDILCSVRAMRMVYQMLTEGAPYVRTSGLPFGMNCTGYTTQFLGTSLAGHLESTLETGWGKIFDATVATDIEIHDVPSDDRLRFTLDYEEDYRFFSAVITALKECIVRADDAKIISTVYDQGLYPLNEAIAQKYWTNFYRCMQQEEGA